VGVRSGGVVALVAATLALAAGARGDGPSPSAADGFREAGELLRQGDGVKAMAIYRDLAASGAESGSLYWNWAQAASSRGETGEALWAALRVRELEPADRALPREIQRLREAANLDPAEIAPEPLAVLARVGRRFRLDLLATTLAVLSVVAHALARRLPARRWPSRVALGTFALAVVAAIAPVAAMAAHPTGVVVRRDAPLLDAASPTAATIGSLRLGEAVPIDEETAGYLRVEDSSGARGWARRDDVWPLDRPPARQ
jgi:hypothetical protein